MSRSTETSTPSLTAPALDAPDLHRIPPRFRIEKLLGRGSQRSVYLARDTERGHWVAVSIFDARALSQVDLERIKQVNAIAGSGAHPHVLPIDHVSEVEGTLFMVSPFVAGGDLANRLEKCDGRPLPLAETLRIASQVARALESVHAAGIAHRDVKPGNILLDERGDAHLVDFGLAVGINFGTYSGVAGTPAYIAPEQIANPPGGISADLYSLGCVLYELTTGGPPFHGEPASEVLLQHQAVRPVPPVERNPAMPRVLSELILKLLEKQPSARPASASDVRAALEGMLRSAGPSTATDSITTSADRRLTPIDLPLVGREREFEVLDAALSKACDSTPGLVLVSGEPGSGKSRLLSELRPRAEARGCVVLMGSGDELRATSYRAFADALLPLAGRFSELAAVHGELLRDFLYRGQDTDRLDRLTPRGVERERLFASAFAALAAFSNARPVVLLLEDLHAFDPASLELFDHLASALLERSERRDLALLVVATTRPPTEEPLGSLITALRNHGSSRTLELCPLDEPAIFDLLTALGSERRPSARLCHKVVKTTDGNPLFVREVVHRLRDAGLLDPHNAESAAEPWDVEFELPSSLSRAIAERVERLSLGCRELLALGALLGARFERARLALVSDRSELEFSEALSEAIVAGLLVTDGVACTFVHPLIVQVIRDQVTPIDRQRLHFRIARRLLDLAPGDSAALLIEIAHHLMRSGALADAAELARIAGRAGRDSLGHFAWHDAAELLEAAIDAERRGAQLSARELAELHRNAGLAYFRLIDEKACLRHYDAAIAGFERVGDDLGLAHALNDRVRIASLLGRSYGDQAKREPLELALARLEPAETTLRAQILNTLAESYWCTGQIERSEQLGLETLETASQASEHRLCADASIDLGMARFIAGRVEEALATWQSGAVHARRANDLLDEQRCLVRASLALTAVARFDEALGEIRTAHDMHRVLQLQSEMSLASGVQVALCTVRGDFEAAERHAADALGRVRRIGYGWGTVLCVPALACARALRSDVAGALLALDRLFEPGMGLTDPSGFESLRSLSSIAHWYAGDRSEIDVREAEALVLQLRGGPGLSALTVGCVLIELADALQAPALAESATGVLATAQRGGFVFSCGWPFFVPRLRGVAEVLAGRFELAEEQLSSAIAIAERVGAGIELARSQLDLARLLATRNSGDDRMRANDLLEVCRPVLAERGPATFVDRADHLYAFLRGERLIHP